jgi:hypothetical protein
MFTLSALSRSSAPIAAAVALATFEAAGDAAGELGLLCAPTGATHAALLQAYADAAPASPSEVCIATLTLMRRAYRLGYRQARRAVVSGLRN